MKRFSISLPVIVTIFSTVAIFTAIVSCGSKKNNEYLDFIPGQVIDLTRDSYSAYSHTSYGGYIRMIEIAPQSYVEPVDSI